MGNDDVSLKEYFDSRLDAMNKAIGVALAANEKRLDSLNEIRGAMKDQAALFATQKDLDPIRASIADLRETRAEHRGMATRQSVIVAYVIAFIGILIGIMNLLRQ